MRWQLRKDFTLPENAWRGVIFIYPIHGGFMGKGATKLSYGKYKTYNSIYFETYETIKKLAQDKSKPG